MSAFTAGRLHKKGLPNEPLGEAVEFVCACGEKCADVQAWRLHRATVTVKGVLNVAVDEDYEVGMILTAEAALREHDNYKVVA